MESLFITGPQAQILTDRAEYDPCEVLSSDDRHITVEYRTRRFSKLVRKRATIDRRTIKTIRYYTEDAQVIKQVPVPSFSSQPLMVVPA